METSYREGMLAGRCTGTTGAARSHAARPLRWAVLALSWVASTPASAAPAGSLDARSLAMGGMGAALLDGPAAALQNPAAVLQSSGEELSLSATGLLTRRSQTAPFLGDPTGSTTLSQDSTQPWLPSGTLAVSYQIHPRLAGGLTLSLMPEDQVRFEAPLEGSPITSEWGDACCQEDWRRSTQRLEMSLPLAMKVLDGLVLGVQPRAQLFQQSSQVSGLSTDSQDTKGIGPVGLRVGLRYQALPWISLGVAYTARSEGQLNGTFSRSDSVDPELNVDSQDITGSLRIPHGLRLGVGMKLMQEKLWLGLEGGMDLHDSLEDSNPEGRIDSWNANLGAQYLVSDGVALRLGMSAWNSPIAETRPETLAAPPGLEVCGHAGAGLQTMGWSIDGGAYACQASTTVRPDQSEDPALFPHGTYSMSTLSAVVSVGYGF